MNVSFVHLRVQSEYSLPDGFTAIDKLAGRVKEWGMPGVALTDRMSVAGQGYFARRAQDEGIQAIHGCIVDVYADRDDSRSTPPQLLLLVMNDAGWLNLCRLLTGENILVGGGWGESSARIALVDLAARNEGLILLTGGPGGPMDRALAAKKHSAARDMLRYLRNAFGDRLYFEVRHRTGEAAWKLAGEMGIEPVLTFDCRWLDPADAAKGRLAEAMRRNISLADLPDDPEPHHLATIDEIGNPAGDVGRAARNTATVAGRCAFTMRSRQSMPMKLWPSLALEQLRKLGSADPKSFLASLPDDKRPAYVERLEHEFAVIDETGSASWFLLLHLLADHAGERRIALGSGRGRTPSSLLLRVLGVTDVDPVEHSLYFEALLTPGGESVPKISLEVEAGRRDELVHTISEWWGGRIAAVSHVRRASPRETILAVARARGVSITTAHDLAGLLPDEPRIGLAQAGEHNPHLAKRIGQDTAIAELMDLGLGVEGLFTGLEYHPNCVATTDGEADLPAPTGRDRRDMPTLLMDDSDLRELGVCTLPIIPSHPAAMLRDAQKLVASRTDMPARFKLASIPGDDAGTSRLLSRGDTEGIVDLEDDGLRDLLVRFRPERLSHLMLLLAVYRPGLDGIMDAILSRRHGRDPVQFAHPSLESVLAETFGELVYQEQVIRIAIEVAGFDGSAAVAFQRKMSTRYDEVGCRRVFTIGAAGKEFDEMTAGAIFRQLTRAQQAVWKSHAAATATRAWRSAWLKAHYPAEFAEAFRHACDCEVRRFWHAR